MSTKKFDAVETMYIAKLIGNEKAAQEKRLARGESMQSSATVNDAKDNLKRLDSISQKICRLGLNGDSYHIRNFMSDVTHYYNWALAELAGDTVNA